MSYLKQNIIPQHTCKNKREFQYLRGWHTEIILKDSIETEYQLYKKMQSNRTLKGGILFIPVHFHTLENDTLRFYKLWHCL